MPRDQKSDGREKRGDRRAIVVVLGGAALIGLALAVAHFRSAASSDAANAANANSSAHLPIASSGSTSNVSVALFDAGAALANAADGSFGEVATSDLDAAVDAESKDIAVDAGGYIADFSGGSWVLEHHIVDHGVSKCGGEDTMTFRRIRYVTDGGALTKDLAPYDDSCPHGVEHTITTKLVFDFDGDGSQELVLVDNTQDPTAVGFPDDESTIWTVWNGKIQRYDLSKFGDGDALPDFTEAKDVDHDGRPDLLTSWRLMQYHTGGPSCPMDNSIYSIFALHSLRGGGFSPSDKASKAFTDEECSASRYTLKDELESDSHSLATAIVCARWQGRSAADVTATLKKACTRFEADHCDPDLTDAGQWKLCPEWALDLAKATLPAR